VLPENAREIARVVEAVRERNLGDVERRGLERDPRTLDPDDRSYYLEKLLPLPSHNELSTEIFNLSLVK
jgi:hypothetical protein